MYFRSCTLQWRFPGFLVQMGTFLKMVRYLLLTEGGSGVPNTCFRDPKKTIPRKGILRNKSEKGLNKGILKRDFSKKVLLNMFKRTSKKQHGSGFYMNEMETSVDVAIVSNTISALMAVTVVPRANYVRFWALSDLILTNLHYPSKDVD